MFGLVLVLGAVLVGVLTLGNDDASDPSASGDSGSVVPMFSGSATRAEAVESILTDFCAEEVFTAPTPEYDTVLCVGPGGDPSGVYFHVYDTLDGCAQGISGDDFCEADSCQDLGQVSVTGGTWSGMGSKSDMEILIEQGDGAVTVVCDDN